MLRIGFIDLDTSHPAAWLPIVRRSQKADVVAICDMGDVRGPGYAAQFAKTHGIPHACASPEEMAERVDAAVILGCNWDAHLERARPFVEAGKPVFIDKPVVGRMQDVELLDRWLKSGADIIGGSAVRYAPQVERLRAEVGPENIYSLFATCPGDIFHYGIHSYELVTAVMGGGIAAVTYVGGERPAVFRLRYGDGRQALIQLETPAGRAHMIVSHTRGVDAVDLSRKDPYGPLIGHMLAHFRRERPFPTPTRLLLECCRAAIAGRLSRETGTEVPLSTLPSDAGYDGNAFARAYRAALEAREPA